MEKLSFKVGYKFMEVELIYNFVSNTYWGKNRSFEEQKKAMKSTINIGMFMGENQVAYCRVMTDKMFFAYLLDMLVFEEYQGKGYSKKLLDFVMDMTDLKIIDKWMLATADAHKLYEKFGFEKVKSPEKLMEKLSERAKEVYL